jgi:hypothetical protein
MSRKKGYKRRSYRKINLYIKKLENGVDAIAAVCGYLY